MIYVSIIIQQEQQYTVYTKAQKGSSSTLALISALDGVGGQNRAPATLPPGKTRYPLHRRLGGPRDSLEECGDFYHPQGFDPGPSSH